MLGGMSGGGMGFIFGARSAGGKGQERLQEIMLTAKRDWRRRCVARIRWSTTFAIKPNTAP